MKKLVFFAACILGALPARAEFTEVTPRMGLGFDVALPYIVTFQGDGINRRGNVNVGFDYRYFTSDNLNFGIRFAMDVEEHTTDRQYFASPGVQYQWFQGHTWMPYIRGDLPVILDGAFTSTADSTYDLGTALGGGVGWNIGNQIGLDHLILRYDFNVFYYFGLQDALNSFGFEFFRFGMDYRF